MTNGTKNEAAAILKAELKRKGVSYAQLAEKLSSEGLKENEANLRNKFSRGSFTANFFVQCLRVIGCETVRVAG